MKLARFLLWLPVLAGSAFAQLPDAPRPRLDRIERIELSADTFSRGLDVYSTAWNHEHGGHEFILPDAIANHSGTLAIFDAGAVFMEYRFTAWLNARGHRREARIFAGIDACSTGFFDSQNFRIRERAR